MKYFEQIYHDREGFLRKKASRWKKNFPEPTGEGNLILETSICANTPPNMIYLFFHRKFILKLTVRMDRKAKKAFFKFDHERLPNTFCRITFERVKKANFIWQIPRQSVKKT